MPEISGKTRIFGVIASPIAHVRAPMVFNPEFARRNIDAVLVPMHILPENLPETLNALAQLPNCGGVAVTIPHKMTAASLCDELGMGAEISGAVNAIRFEDGRMIGDNFDGMGFVAGLIGEGHDPKGKDALLLGAGGAGRAVALALAEVMAESGAGRLTIHNRDATKAEALVALLKAQYPQLAVAHADAAQINTMKARANLLINATSLGLHDDDALPLALEGVIKGAVIADIIMVPEMTKWLMDAERRGLTCHKGRYMFDYQKDLIANFIGAWE